MDYTLQSKRWSPHLLIIITLPFLLFWRWVFLGEVLYWGTLLFQFWPWHSLVKKSLLAGQWPLWNPLLGNGTPLLANLQSAVFYPPNLLYLFLPVEHGLTLSVILHLALAGLFMYFYARQIKLGPFAATLSALTYMLSGYLVGRTQFVTMLNGAAWIPIALLLCEIITKNIPLKKVAGKAVLGLGLVLAMQLLAGHAQLWFYTLWLIGGYTLFRSWQRGATEEKREQTLGSKKVEDEAKKEAAETAGLPGGKMVRARTSRRWNRWIAVGQAIWRLGLAGGVAILLAAVQLLPTAEFTLQSPRQTGAERAFALSYSFWPWRLITLVAPNFFGHPANNDYWGYANFWEDHAYIGIFPFLMALTALWGYFRKRSNHPAWRVAPFFAGLLPISLILAMGWNTPIYLWVFNTVPGFGYFQAPARLLIWYTVAMAVLAGVGAQFFELTLINRPRWRRWLVASIGLIMAGLAGSLILSGRSRTFLLATLLLGLWLTLSVSLVLAQPGPGSRRGRLNWQWAVIGLVALDLFVAAHSLIPTLPPHIFRQPIASAAFLKSQPDSYRFFVADEYDYAIKFNHYFRFDTFGPAETGHWQQFRETLVPNVGVYADLPSANNDDPLVVGRWQHLVDHLGRVPSQQREQLLQLMNVGYSVGKFDQAIGPAIYQGQDLTIYEVSNPRPRAYFVPQAYVVKNEAEAIARLTASDFDSRQEVVIINSEAEAFGEIATGTDPDEVNGQTGSVSVGQPRPDQVLITVKTSQPGFVVLTDTFYPGWRATLDKQPTVIWPANLAFRAVVVEQPGTHTILLRYEPRSFTIGLWISGVTLLVGVILNHLKRKPH